MIGYYRILSPFLDFFIKKAGQKTPKIARFRQSEWPFST